MDSEQTFLIEFICPKCKRSIAWARPNTTVYCKKCDRWIAFKDLRDLNPAKMDPENLQLKLF